MNIFGLGSGKTKTFRPKRKRKNRGGVGAPDVGEFSFANLRADLRKYVVLPESQCEEEWLAVHTQDFYNLTNVVYGTLSQYCTEEQCPVMSAGPLYEYWWRDEVKKKAQQVSAPVYVDSLMQWIEDQMGDETLFPSSATIAATANGGDAAGQANGSAASAAAGAGAGDSVGGSGASSSELWAVTNASSAFPSNFKSVVKKIFSRLFRVYGHIYHSHLQHIIALDQEAHVNSVLLHLVFFIQEFDLVDAKELEPLKDVIDRLVSAATAATASTSTVGTTDS